MVSVKPHKTYSITQVPIFRKLNIVLFGEQISNQITIQIHFLSVYGLIMCANEINSMLLIFPLNSINIS